MGRTEINIQMNPLYSKAWFDALKSTTRKKIVLGRAVHRIGTNVFTQGKIAYHIPSPFRSLTESIYCKGPPGSGKSWLIYSLAVQTYFSENRTWVLFDTKGSVSWDTLVLIRENGYIRQVHIGEFIDQYLPNHPDRQHEIGELPNVTEVLSVGSDHKVTWRKIIQISKHLPSTPIIKIHTASQREVIATTSHSFLTLKNGEYGSIQGKDLHVGDHIPVASVTPHQSEQTLHVLDYFRPEEVLDFDQVQSAVNAIGEGTVSEAYICNGLCQISYGGFWRYSNGERDIPAHSFKCITAGNHSKSTPFPKEIEMDRLSGFFFGMFVAEGHAESTKGQRSVFISNYTNELLIPIQQWLDRYNIYYRRTAVGIAIRSMALTNLLIRLFGKGDRTNSHTKHIPDIFLNANPDFLKGFIDGYMSGDGSIRKVPRYDITFSTRSQQLRSDLNIIFTRFGMPLRFTQQIGKDGQYMYSASVHSSDILKFKTIDFTEPPKHHRLMEYHDISGLDSKHLIDVDSILTGISWRKETKCVKNALHKPFITMANAKRVAEDLREHHPDKAQKLLTLANGDVWWDEIDAIETIPSPSDHVYDFAVEETENFMLSNGMLVHNSYLGNNRPNMAYADKIRECGGRPRGIPGSQIDVISPLFYVQEADPSEVKQKHITATYKIPLRILELNAMFEIVKMNAGAGYAGSFDQKWKDKKIDTHGNPKISDIFDVCAELGAKKKLKRVASMFDMLYEKLQEVADRVIDDKHRWSRLGEALFQAAQEGKPRWIVFTFTLTRHPQEDVNLALVSNALNEIYDFAEYARHNNLKIALGVMIDELHTYVRNKEASTREAIHDLLMAWGRTSRIIRAFLTQRDEQLDKVFRDEIGKLSPIGTYDVIIECRRIPESGYLGYLSRATPNLDNPEIPLWYPSVKSVPPICEVESDDTDDEHWKHVTAERYHAEHRVPKWSNGFPASDDRLKFQPPSPI